MSAIVIDGRKLSKDQIRAKAQKHFDIKTIEEDSGGRRGDHGFFLNGDPLHYYHVASVKRGMYVASTRPLSPKETRLMVKTYTRKKKEQEKGAIIYKITAIARDWKEGFDTKDLNRAYRITGNGAELIDVEKTYSDTYVMICANPPITSEQAQQLFDAGNFHVCEEHEGTFEEIIEKLKRETK